MIILGLFSPVLYKKSSYWYSLEVSYRVHWYSLEVSDRVHWYSLEVSDRVHWYSLEVSDRVHLLHNDYPQHVFVWKKIQNYPPKSP